MIGPAAFSALGWGGGGARAGLKRLAAGGSGSGALGWGRRRCQRSGSGTRTLGWGRWAQEIGLPEIGLRDQEAREHGLGPENRSSLWAGGGGLKSTSAAMGDARNRIQLFGLEA